jgi:hypothetical protein
VGIFDRLGDVIKSYLNDEDGRIFGAPHPKESGPRGDPDLKAAWDELNDELDGFPKGGAGPQGKSRDTQSQAWSDNRRPGVLPPENLRSDFALLGVPFGAAAVECKTAYKRLLKLHHPDRHAGHEGNMKKATEKSARINAAYDRIEKWRIGGTV